MRVSPRPLATWCAAAVLAAGCTQTVAGDAVRATPGIDDDSQSPVDVETIMLDQSQMRAITGAGDDLTIIPSMDGKVPVDIDPLAENRSPAMPLDIRRDPDIRRRRRGVPQDHLPGSARCAALISQGAAAYRDPATAHRAFDDLVSLADGCGSTPLGSSFVGDVTADRGRTDDPVRHVRSRLPGEVRCAGRGHLLPIPRFGARHRDDQHPGESARLVSARSSRRPNTSSPSASGRYSTMV